METLAERMVDDASRGEWIEAALRRFEAPLLRYAARLLGSEEGARDAVQETFLRLCQADRARVDDHLAQWLYTVCRTRVLDARRKERPVERLDETNTPAVPGHALAAVEAHEGRSRVLELVDGLPDAEKEVLMLRFQDGLSYRDIGEVTGRTVSHVGVLLHQAVKRMREALAAGATALEKAAGRAR